MQGIWALECFTYRDINKKRSSVEIYQIRTVMIKKNPSIHDRPPTLKIAWFCIGCGGCCAPGDYALLSL